MADKGEREFQTLAELMDEHRPACRGDERFVQDDPPLSTKRELAAICERCPLLDACDAYASKAKPKAGFWGTHALRIQKGNK